MRFVSYNDRKKVAAELRRVYTAPTADAAKAALEEFAGSELGKRHPATVAAWERAWERFTPFLAFPPALRKIIYTTNAIWVLCLPAWAGRCFPDRSWKRPALTLNAIDAERLSWTRNVGLAA
jgi:transposase-like protein